MFDFITRHRRVAQIFLALIAITFATWGIESYTRLRGGRECRGAWMGNIQSGDAARRGNHSLVHGQAVA